MSLTAVSKSSVALASLAALTIFSAPLVWALFKIRKRITAPLVLWAALDNVPLYSSIPQFKSFIFTTILGFVNPYSRSIPLTIKTLSEGRCDAEMFDRNSIRNPFASIHACALTLLAETVGGLAVFKTLDKKKKDRAIVTRIDTAYFKKSRGCIFATCTFAKPNKAGKYSLVPCDVEMRDKATGDLTAKATIYWEIDVKEFAVFSVQSHKDIEMGLFENTTIKNKDAHDLYDAIKSHYVLLLQNNALDGVGNNLPKSSTFNEFANATHKAAMKNIKKAFEPILPQTAVLSLDISLKQLTMEATLALFRALRTRDDHNQLTWPVSEINLSGTKFCSHDKNTKSAGDSRKTEDEKYQDRLEKLVFTELCELLRETKTLKSLNLSENPIGNEWMSKVLIFGVRMSPSLEELNICNTGLDNGAMIPEIMIEMLLDSNATRKLVKTRRIAGSVHRNLTLRRLLASGHAWSTEATDLFCALVFHCPRLVRLEILNDPTKAESLQYNGKTLKYLLQRNLSVSTIYDLVESNVFKRPFKTKLNTFRQSVKDNKLKNRKDLSVEEENGPAYKWIAKSEQNKADPFHPTVFPSVNWKSGYAISVGRRQEMQDVLAMRGRFREIPGTDEKPNVFEDWWAIFDGHGGREAASYAAENLHQIIATNLDQLTNPSVDDRAEAIKKAFQSCNKQMAPWNPITGTTVVSVYMHDNFRYVCNLGDSRCLLYNSKQELPSFLTRDHKPNDPIEKKRIMAIPGGFIEDGRLNGKLSVSRSLGDSSLVPYVSCIPDINVQEIDPDDEFLVLATDGLWDTLAPEGISATDRNSGYLSTPTMVSKQLEESKEIVRIVQSSSGPSAASKKLVEYAYNKGSTDNISVVVIFLKHQGNAKGTLSKTGLANARRQSGYINDVNNGKNRPASLVSTPSRTTQVKESSEPPKSTENINAAVQQPQQQKPSSQLAQASGTEVKKEVSASSVKSKTSSGKKEEPIMEEKVVRSALAASKSVTKGKISESKDKLNQVHKRDDSGNGVGDMFGSGNKIAESETNATKAPEVAQSNRTSKAESIKPRPSSQYEGDSARSSKHLNASNTESSLKKTVSSTTVDANKRKSRSFLNILGADKQEGNNSSSFFKGNKLPSNANMKEEATEDKSNSALHRANSHEKVALVLPIEAPSKKESVADSFADEMFNLINSMKF